MAGGRLSKSLLFMIRYSMISPTRQRNAASTLLHSFAEVSKNDRPRAVARVCKKWRQIFDYKQFLNFLKFAVHKLTRPCSVVTCRFSSGSSILFPMSILTAPGRPDRSTKCIQSIISLKVSPCVTS